MKIVARCCNCNQVTRRSKCYHVKLLGKISDNTMFEKPNWIDYEEKVFICKPCALQAGYKVKGGKNVIEKVNPRLEKLN